MGMNPMEKVVKERYNPHKVEVDFHDLGRKIHGRNYNPNYNSDVSSVSNRKHSMTELNIFDPKQEVRLGLSRPHSADDITLRKHSHKHKNQYSGWLGINSGKNSKVHSKKSERERAKSIMVKARQTKKDDKDPFATIEEPFVVKKKKHLNVIR